MSCNGDEGKQGMPGPASMTDFEIKNGCWKQEHAELQNLCLKIMNFIETHPDIASKVEITRCAIKSTI